MITTASINIIPGKKPVDKVRREVKEALSIRPRKHVKLYSDSKWLTFWSNERDFLPELDMKWLSIILTN